MADEPDIERLARALCREWGHDPEARKYSSIPPGPANKLWHTYRDDARRLLVEQRALQQVGKWKLRWVRELDMSGFNERMDQAKADLVAKLEEPR